jgi:adenylate cyclase
LELDSYYALFAARIAAYRADPPPADWDGAFTALEK